MADGVELKIEAKSLPSVARGVEELARRAEDPAPLMDEIGSLLTTSTIDRFERERAPDGQPWLPSIRAREEGGQTLTESARLRTSITHRVGNRSVEIGTNVVYAAVHQLGATIRAKHAKALRFKVGGRFATVKQVTIPARPFLGVSAGDERAIGEAVADYLGSVPA